MVEPYADSLPRLLTSASGAVVGTLGYGPYGKPAEPATATQNAVSTSIGFAGGYTDTETGLIYLINRYYDPATGQFLTRDPMLAVTGERCGYVWGDPLNLIDPLGLSWLNPLSWTAKRWATVAAVTGAVAGAALLCVATACIGDIAAAAGATTLEGVLTTAEITGDVAEKVASVSGLVGGAADSVQVRDTCSKGWSAECGASLGAVGLDLVGFGGERLIDEFSIWKSIYTMASNGVVLTYAQIADALAKGDGHAGGLAC